MQEGLIHLSSPGPSGPLLFNTCPEPCSLRTVLSSLCGEQLSCARPLGFSYGNGRTVHASHGNAQGIYCPLLALTFYCSISTPRTKWLRIDCSNLFILRQGGSVSRPKITLKSDYIQFLTPGTNNFLLAPSQQLCTVGVCVSVNMHVCRCVCVACVLLSTFLSVCVFQMEKLQACLELLGDILSYHESCSADVPHSSQVHHRMAYTGTAIFTVKLLQTILPPEKVCVCLCDTIMMLS